MTEKQQITCVPRMEVCDIVQEAVIKTIPKERKCKKAKWLSEEALQIAEKRREVKAKEKRKDRDTKRIFHAKMGTIKDRNSMDLTEAEDIKKRWQEYTEELHKKKDFHDRDNPDGVITHLEPDILECESQVGLRKHHYE